LLAVGSRWVGVVWEQVAATASMSPWPAATTWPRLASHRPEAAAHPSTMLARFGCLAAMGPHPFPGMPSCRFTALSSAPLPTRLLAPLFLPCLFRTACIGRAAHRTRFFWPHPFSMLMLPPQRSRSLEYIGAVFLQLPVPVALTRSLSSRHLRAHHPTPFPGSRSSLGEHVESHRS